ncbi:dienelactone hydrolase family protein [Paraflavisolibacter sp. H34]|uniref:dienelactone hydrolase family protein n=1 Tax=Huijunlia imazamoxiresistens TaxID=3127457 RepID=UPI003017033A
MDQRIINLYDEYTHKPLSRQEFLRRLALLTGSIAAATNMLPFLESSYAHAATVKEDDLFTERITYPGEGNTLMQAYVARPRKMRTYPAVVVIHENRGLNAHIEDVTRRAAQAGYLAIAPNALSPLGGTPANEDEARQQFTKLNEADTRKNFIRVFDYLDTRKDSNKNYGCVGFCWGGAMANHLAVNVPALKAAVAFYGRQPEATDVPRIKGAVQLHYAGLDERINAGIPAYEEALKKAGTPYELYLYEGVNHAFHNDTAPTRYNEAAAKLAWQRTLDFFGKYLRRS